MRKPKQLTTIRRSRTIESAGGVTDGRKTEANTQAKLKFWDHRPFTRVVQSLKAVLNLKDYIRVNHLEGEGYHREDARMIIEIERDRALDRRNAWRGTTT